MNIRRRICTILLGIAGGLCIATAALANGTLIRWQKMGEEESGANNDVVSSTLASPIDSNDTSNLTLNATNSPVYRTISGRPDGGTGLGIEFSAASQQYLSGPSLNWPNSALYFDSDFHLGHAGSYDLKGIDDRAFQLWVKPSSAAAQSIVMDTNNHGVRIDSNGKFAMRFVNVDYESPISVTPNTWYHIEVVHPTGISGGSRMYINGVAAAVAIPLYSNDYPSDATNMTVGSNVTSDGDFFGGVVDDLQMYVFGTTTSAAHIDYGAFNLATDNAYISSPVTGLSGVAGDVNNNGTLSQADKDAFIAGWLHKRLVNGYQVGDMISHAQGDLNFDGITNIQDLALIQNALTGSGIGAITPADLAGVPEPATALLLLVAGIAMPMRMRIRSIGA